LKTLDLRGLKCPLPVLKTRRILSALAPGERLEVACTDPLSAIDLPNLVRETGDVLESQSQDGSALVFTIRRAGTMKERATLAAIVYRENEAIDDLLAQARDKIAAHGFRVGGVMQDPCGETIHVTLLDTGRRINITQELGACAEGCRLDTSALAEAAGLLAQSLRNPPDLLLIARFGRVELEGGGFLAEIAEAASAGVPTLVGVADTREEGWRAFAGDFAESLPCSLDAVLDWWAAVAPKR
jgi:TusA-related sulfurtransferase